MVDGNIVAVLGAGTTDRLLNFFGQRKGVVPEPGFYFLSSALNVVDDILASAHSPKPALLAHTTQDRISAQTLKFQRAS